MDDSVKQLVKDVIDSICFPCARRIIHFQYFVMTSSSQNSNTYWITEYLKEKRTLETKGPLIGCGICFGLLEKYSQSEYLTEVRFGFNFKFNI